MFVVAVEFVIEEEHVEDFRQQAILQSQNSLKLEEACRVFDVCCDPECATGLGFFMRCTTIEPLSIDIARPSTLQTIMRPLRLGLFRRIFGFWSVYRIQNRYAFEMD